MAQQHLDPNEVENYLQAIPDHQVFTVVVEKKDGTLRKMNCRRGVTKKLKGGESTIKEHPNLQGVYDMNALDDEGVPGAYRCFDKTRVKLIVGLGTEKRIPGFKGEDVIDAKGNPAKVR